MLDTDANREDGEVGLTTSVRVAFRLDRSVAQTWNSLKDFNLWLADLNYDSIVGEAAQASRVSFTIRPEYYEHYATIHGIDARAFPKTLITRMIVPERLIVHEELSEDQRDIAAYYVFAIGPQDSGTAVSVLMSYCAHVGATGWSR